MPRTNRHVRGKHHAHPHGVIHVNPAGYGFVTTSEGEFFIPCNRIHYAFDGDVVEVAKMESGQTGAKPTAKVVKVLERAHVDIVGRYEKASPFGVVVPADPRIQYDIFTPLDESDNVPDGSMVRVRIAQYPSRSTAATGTIIEVLAGEGEDAMIDVIIARHKFETGFGEAALQQAESLSVDVEQALRMGYTDNTSRYVFTVDPVDARDFDDAISIERTEKHGAQWKLGVHIADVSSYVPWDSPIDLEARRRATSVYLVDRVLPMLPERLSNDLCSLRPGEVRRAMSVDMYVDGAANVVYADMYPSLIRSRARLSYDEALQMIEQPDGSELSCHIGDLYRVSCMLQKAACARGVLDFATQEAHMVLDGQGAPVSVQLKEKTAATEMIEQAMILANQCVAKYMLEQGHPSLYRIHDQPLPETLANLSAVFDEFPWFARVDVDLFAAGNPHELQRVLRESSGRLEEYLVSSLLIRSMNRAVYRPVCSRHYGLAAEAYTHFTSPIRRYPDLVVHRMLKDALGHGGTDNHLRTGETGDGNVPRPVAGRTGNGNVSWVRAKSMKQQVESLAWIAEHASSQEREADSAAFESQEVKLIEYMARFVGQSFRGIVSGVTTSGVYVRLENTAEGFIDSRDLGRGYFAFDPVRHLLRSEETLLEYRLGQRLDVTIKRADPKIRSLTFVLA